MNKVVDCVKIVFILRMKLEIVLKKALCLNEISNYEILVVIVEQLQLASRLKIITPMLS